MRAFLRVRLWLFPMPWILNYSSPRRKRSPEIGWFPLRSALRANGSVGKGVPGTANAWSVSEIGVPQHASFVLAGGTGSGNVYAMRAGARESDKWFATWSSKGLVHLSGRFHVRRCRSSGIPWILRSSVVVRILWLVALEALACGVPVVATAVAV